MARQFCHAACSPIVRRLADKLGLNVGCLRREQIGYATASDLRATGTKCSGPGCWSFPMRDGNDHITGIRLRSRDGFKYSVTGSDASGLFIPKGTDPIDRVLIAPEGPTSNAAILMLGLTTVGRPNNSLGTENLCRLAIRLRPSQIVLLGDNDQKPDGRWPGRDGAMSVAAGLSRAGIRARVVLPPPDFKDARDWVRDGATKQDVIRWIEHSARRMTCDAI
jgi:phage/plasmid primase-like uncharacterized protein